MTDVELIKAKVDIVTFLSEYITLKRAGRNFKALCPFHSEKTPSFVVSVERGSWHCFGACNEGGDVIAFLQKWEGIEFLEALKILAKRAGVTLSHYAPTESLQLKERLYEINHLTSEFYHYLLTMHRLGKRAMEYLNNRHIKPETIKTFMLGYAPLSWDSLFKYLQKKGYSRDEIHSSGLLVKTDRGTYYDRFRGRLMFTLFDQRRNIVGFSGRKLPPEDESQAKYVNTPETPIYTKGNILYGLEVTKEAIKKTCEAVVVEGEFDFLASFQSGVSNIVAIKGSALTEGQVLLLRRYTEDVILALDSDFAGNEAAKRGLETAEGNGLSVRVARLLYGKDPAECVEKDPLLWKKSIKEAVPIYDFIISNAIAKYGKESAVAKKKVGNEAIPILAKITNPIVSSHYVKYFARQLEINEESVEMAIRQFQKKGETQTAITTEPSKTSREVLLEEHLIALIVQSDDAKEALSQAFLLLVPDDLRQPVFKKIVELLEYFLKQHKKFDRKNFGSLLPAEFVSAFDRACMMDVDKILADKTIFDRELKRTAIEIKKLSLKRRVNDLSRLVRQKEESKDKEEFKTINEELRSLIGKIKDLDKST